MGVINHNAVLVTTSLDSSFNRLTAFLHERKIPFIASTPTNNNYRTVVIHPDGSKEEWDDSNLGDENRQTVIEWMMNTQKFYASWVEVGYGEYGTAVLRNNCSNMMNDEPYGGPVDG